MPTRPELPPPPRAPRWRAVLRHRWVLGLCGATLLAAGFALAVVIWAEGGDVLPLGDDALDASHAIAEGEVLRISDPSLHLGGTRLIRVDYRFRPNEGGDVTGHSFSPPRAGLLAGAQVRIEYLPDDPEVSRVRGSTRNPFGSVWTMLMGVLVMPAFLATLWWLRGVMRLRLLLGTGRATTAEIVGRTGVFGVSPPQWRVAFRFRDVAGHEHAGSHWVGERSALGRDLASADHTATLVYDEGDPSECRLACPDDFAT